MTPTPTPLRLEEPAERRPGLERSASVSKCAALISEYLDARRRMRVEDARSLMGHGISWRAITIAGPAPVQISLSLDGDLYWPDELGHPAWVLPVRVVDPWDPQETETGDWLDVVSHGPIVDLLAFSPLAPRCWALRRGIATVLGAIEPQYPGSEPVPVHRDVTDWLRNSCRGLVLLACDPHDAAAILRRIERLEAEDNAHVDDLRRLLALPVPVHSMVTVRQAPT
jgi:hypothetical protein